MRDKIKQLKNFNTASFAVWPFNEETDISKLHADVVIVGLNPSKEVIFGVNFHGGHFDTWCQEAFSRPPFAGAYMTDLISSGEPSATVIVEKWKDKNFKEKHVKNLKQQFSILEIDEETPIVCFGKITESLFRKTFPEYHNVHVVKNPNSYRMKNSKQAFLDDVVVIRNKLLL
jgi:hypothetical protein